MKEYYAHSPKEGHAAQIYKAHVNAVTDNCVRFANEAAKFSPDYGKLLVTSVKAAALYHDLGKLDNQNQAILSGQKKAKALPVNHVDAGAAYLRDISIPACYAALAIYAHHKGLPDLTLEELREQLTFRDERIKNYTDEHLPNYIKIHDSIIKSHISNCDISNTDNAFPIFLRILLSCLVDADHSDTAANYDNYKFSDYTPLRAQERLQRLNQYVRSLGTVNGKRDILRKKMYQECLNTDINTNIAACDSPVGSGKTTAVMAHLLNQAQKRGMRRIFVVLPYTNIITQAVNVYRNALVLPGENPAEVVAELHHRADFENADLRQLTALWRAPIIVTTAVSFFETLAASKTSALRRLHELPGSAIFVDESHAALPAKLLPIAWKWIKGYADEWSCYWVLASGSLNKFWEIEAVSGKDNDDTHMDVPQIISDGTREELDEYEKNRVTYINNLNKQSLEELLEEIHNAAGPSIAVFNTIQSAAAAADLYAKTYGRSCVEHLSTALTPSDRAKTLKRVTDRLKDRTDTNWVLIATSCVEAGMDFSFKTGFRELSSLTSLLQLSGRVNRNGAAKEAFVNTFYLKDDNRLENNPQLEHSRHVLEDIMNGGKPIEPALVTYSIEKEINEYGVNSEVQTLPEAEDSCNFPEVAEKFLVIDDHSQTAVADPKIIDDIKFGKADWQQFQDNSFKIGFNKIKNMRLPRISDEIYIWDKKYDNFLGYMAGYIEYLNTKDGFINF